MAKLVATCFHNGLGNFIMFIPALRALHKMTGAKIDLYLDKKWTDSRRPPVEFLFNSLEFSNKIVEFDINTFRKDKYEEIFWVSHGERFDCWHYFRDIATIKSEFEDEDDSWLQTKEHEIEFYMSGLYNNGYRGKIPKQIIGVRYQFGRHHRDGETYTISCKNMLTRLKVGFCNGYFVESTWDWSRKAWPHFQHLAIMLYNTFGTDAEISLLGKGKEEKKWAKSVKGSLAFQDYNVKNFVDKLDILATIRKITVLDVLVTTDTGLMHIADALNVPLIVLFGSTLASKNGPYMNKKARLVQSLLNCAPCQNTPNFHICETYRCMQEITPADVMGELLKLLDDLGYKYPEQV